MKRNVDNAFGSARSVFQPVQQRSRVDLSSYPSTLPPGLGVGQPVMRSIATRVPVHIVWQDFSNNSTALSSLVQKERSDFDRNLIAAKAEELRTAILSGNSETIAAILSDQDASEIALVKDERGRNALFHAIEKNDLVAMDRLFSLSSRSELVMQRHHSGAFPLTLAASKGSTLAVIQILNINVANEQVYPEDQRFNPLLIAASMGHEAVVNILLTSPYGAAMAKGKREDGFNALVVAAYKGREAVVRILLASPYAESLLESKNGFNVVMIAAQNGCEGTLKILLASDYAEVLVKQKNNEGLNALMLAAFKGHLGVVRALLEFGFVEEQINGIYGGRGIIQNTIKRGLSTVAELLRQYETTAKQNEAGGQLIMPTTSDQ